MDFAYSNLIMGTGEALLNSDSLGLGQDAQPHDRTPVWCNFGATDAWVGKPSPSYPPKQHKDDNYDQDGAKDTDATVTETDEGRQTA